MDSLLNPELREKTHDGSIKVENISKQVIFKGLAPRVVLSNRLLPKGTKTKVNLEEQGRQKVSFSFMQTKKTRQNVFFATPSSEKAANEISSMVQSANLPSPDQAGQSSESKNEQVEKTDVPAVESQTIQPPAPLPPKSKLDLGKMHFKKQILSVSVVEETPVVNVVSDETPSETDILMKSPVKIEAETSMTQFQMKTVTDSPSEKVKREDSAQDKLDACLKGPTDSSHIGKDSKDRLSVSDPQDKKKPQHSGSSPGDGESNRTSSSQKSSDTKNATKSDSHSTDIKKSTSSKSDVSEKCRSDRKEDKDEKGSSRSTTERDSRHTSSRSTRSDRRRTTSRSRSRSRSSRTASSYSRSERSRHEKQSRLDRSHYHDSERRSHRNSPYRERRRSRSRPDGRSRDSSDSEDDLRKPRTRSSDSSRSSTYSSSQRDSKSSSHSKSYRDSKSIDSSRSSEVDKRAPYSRAERSGRKEKEDSEPSKRSSSESEASHKKSSSHSKSEVSTKTSSSNLDTSSRSSEQKVQKNSGTPDSDEEHRRKSRSSASLSSSSKKSESKSSSSLTGTVGQSIDKLSSNKKLLVLDSHTVVSQGEFKKVDGSQHEDGNQSKLKSSSSQQKEQTKDSSTSQDVGFQGGNKDSGSNAQCPAVHDFHQNADVELNTTVSQHTVVQGHDQLATQTDTLVNNEFQVDAQTNVANVSNVSFSLNEPSCPGYPPSQDSAGSLADTLSVKELPHGECLKPNTKLGHQLVINEDISTMPVNSKVETSCKEPEQFNIKPDAGMTKKGSIPKKSRWDIVGQDTSENQSPKKTVNPDTASVKKVISVKKIEFNSDSNLEEPCSKIPESVVHSLKSEELKQRDCAKEIPTQPVDPGTQQTSDHLAILSPENQVLEVPSKSNCNSDLTVINLDEKYTNHEKLSKDDLYKHETQESESLNCDSKSLSEESETEDSDSDTDDGQGSLKRLHSVVIVPKNSILTHEIADQPASSPSPFNLSGRQQLTCQGNESNKGINSELIYSHTSQSSSEDRKHNVSPIAGDACSLSSDQVIYQSQSNMVDSTSQSETTGALAEANRNCAVHERPKILPTSQAPIHAPENAQRQCDLGRHYDRPDSWHGRKGEKEQHGDFSSSDDLIGKGSFNSAWDFVQPEQPSSTFQQPDSSHSTQPPQAESAFVGPGSGVWTQPIASHKNRPVTSIPSLCHEVVGQIHPDSLTNDNDEDYERKELGSSQAAVPCTERQVSSAFVQAHEISSNCSFVNAPFESQIILEPPREDAQKPHRARGPPKKRRPELESESDNEAEAGLACKRECLEERDACKDSKETKVSLDQEDVQRPLLSLKDFLESAAWKDKARQKKMPPYFDLIEENIYLTERKKNKSHRDIKRMQCECAVLSREERARGVMACGEDCLNRLLMIECSSRCLNGTYCSNRRFQMKQHADVEVILTESKGWGLRAAQDLQPNTFVLEYCGEVLDHREFKSRVKEYARSKNIHYYFMALKNNEIIDATLKGNCSRFMNHSCEPNCETQKWTVNGQLRVGFFTTKAVNAGTELTFDYQFQRYGKEAQKCFCGAQSCRGFLGGENRVSVRAAGGKKQRERSRKKETVSALTTLDEELEALLENGEGLSDEKQVISLCRLMVRVETMEQRLTCIKLIQNTQNHSCLKQFLDHHGLSLLWIFMADLSEAKSSSVNNIKLQLEIMKALAVLPISNKNMLEESRVLQCIQRLAQSRPLGQPPEQDGYSSESTSRAQTPLNTPDGPPAKLAPELDGDTPKRAVYRRLKIISENSLDSALSDASKASDGKEEDEEEEEMEEEVRLDAAEKQETSAETQAEGEPAVKPSDVEESAETKPEQVEEDGKDDGPEEQEAEEKATIKKDEDQPAQAEEENQIVEDEEKSVVEEAKCEPELTELSDQAEAPAEDHPCGPASVKAEEDTSTSVEAPDVGTVSTGASVESEPSEPSASAPDVNITTTDVAAEPSEVTMDTTPASDTTAVSATSDSSAMNLETSSAEKTSAEAPLVPVESAAPTSASIAPEVPSLGTAVATEGVATVGESAAVGTPSQDEEEAVSDVESERSQEPQIRAADISEMAARLLDSWKDLKEVYRIPKKSQVEKESNDRSRDREAMLTPRTPSSSRERERERDRERERERDRERERERDWEREWERERERDLERSMLRSAERRRRRGSASPPPASAYERSSRRTEDRYDQASNSKKKPRTKESRNKLSTEERRKLFEQEVAQREAQKQQQQQQQQQQLQRLVFDPLVYASSPGFMTYPPGYPIQTYVDPSNPNAGKVLLPTPSMEPISVAPDGTTPAVSFEQTPTQPLIADLSMTSPTPSTTQAGTASSLAHMPAHGTQPQPFVQPAVPAQDPGVAVLSVPAQTATPQVPGQQGYATLWDPNTQQAVTVQTQPAQQYSATAQPQTAIYYQGQPCQTIYSIPAGYPQTNTPVIQTYTEPTTGYLHGQQVYTGHQQGVVVQQGGTVTTIVTSQTVQQEMIVPNSIMDLPPPSPPKPKTIILPPNWKVARDPEGKIYYYHVVTRQTQWDPPSWEGAGEEASVEHEAEMDLGTPTYDENPSKFSTKTAEADTSSELAKKSKEVFRKEMSQFIVQCLNPYRKPDCKLGRIGNTEDFKHLARKLTHGVMNKELKSCKNPEDLECNENVKHKTKEYIKKYMQKFGAVYRPKEDTELD
ncbi:hypothetical protein SRHO_G00062800 [Serrasalmus rhombeus]